MPLPDLIAAATRPATEPRATGEGFARPELDSDFRAPETEVEQALAAIWQDLLGLSEVGAEDSFFDLGGHSLIAVRLFAQIRRQWAVDLPISVLFEAPTIAACAALIEARLPEGARRGTSADTPPPASSPSLVRHRHLVAMHPASAPSNAQPVFVVAGMFGNVLNLRHMAQLIGQDRPFYGLQARGLFGDDAPHEDFASAARDYLAEMRLVHPGGPWLLGGFSGGGLIAWEIARQLEAAGEQVGGVVLLDTPQPLPPQMSRADSLRVKLQGLLREGPSYIRDWWQERQAWKQSQLAGPAGAAEGQLQNAAIEAAFRRALGRYEVQPRSGPVMLYRPAPEPRWVVADRQITATRYYIYPDNLWTPFARDLEIVEVPGDHDSMVLEPNVRVLAADLRRRLAQWERG